MWWSSTRQNWGDETSYCDECKELYPKYSRVCPYCSFIDQFFDDFACVPSPKPYLDQMNALLEEALPLNGLGRESGRQWREILTTFETLKSLLLITYDDNEDVMCAMELIEDMLLDGWARRSKRITHLRIVCGGALCVLIVAVIYAIITL